MKKIGYFLLIVYIISASCSGSKKLPRVNINNADTTANDSVEYELIVFDPGFETWYLSHSKPTWYHSQDYYENWNRQYVTEWNHKAMTPRFSRYFETLIDYVPFIDYGLELNHRLFYYFQYVEKVLKIDILPSGMSPHTVF
jgi:hypothetical protein